MNGHTSHPPPTTSHKFHTYPATDQDYLNPFSYADGNDVDPSKLNLGHAKTEITSWRLLDERGRQRWRYLRTEEEAKAWPMNAYEKYALGLDTEQPELPPAKTPLDAARNGLTFFSALQLDPGNWACEYGGPMFLMPGIVITWYVTGTAIPPEYRIEMTNYLFARQHPVDGGWGLHIEGESSVFGTSMNYTTLRLLGVDAEEPRMVKARGLLHKMGGATMGPHWSKFWLSVLGCCEWQAVNPVPPELWLVPDWLPIAPWRWWIHMRQVYLPMSYIWSKQWSFPLNDLTRSIREELYTQPYASIDFAAARNLISPLDNYHPKTSLLNGLNWLLVNIHIPFTRATFLRRHAENYVYMQMEMEDRNTEFSNLGPVNGPMNTICRYIAEGRNSINFRHHLDRLHDFIWMKSEGMLVNGTNGVQTWDTAFAIQAAVDTGLSTDAQFKPVLLKALEFLEDQQILEECVARELGHRHTRRGAWGFSTREQGYTVSDCTAEALKSVLLLQSMPDNQFPTLISEERTKWATDVLLTMQNPSGGFASYETIRGNPGLLERLNAAEVFGGIMVEYDYPECTTAVLLALGTFTKLYPDYRRHEIVKVRADAVKYVQAAQRPDGSWYGSWGICFTYAGMFALGALATVGEQYSNSERVRRGCKFLLEKQDPNDGGWGESYKSCETGKWCAHPGGSQVVQTAMAVIALLEAGFPDRKPVQKAVDLIMSRQLRNGEWPQEGIEGVFNKTCMISYPNYKFVFPIKALGLFNRKVEEGKLS